MIVFKAVQREYKILSRDQEVREDANCLIAHNSVIPF